MTLAELIEASEARASLHINSKLAKQQVKVVTDTRVDTLESAVFLALQGENFDGHHFVKKAFDLGAVAAVVNRSSDIFQSAASNDDLLLGVGDSLQAYGKIANAYRRKFRGQVVAITGSVGKTTVKSMLQSVFSFHAESYATKKNFNNEIGVPATLLQASGDEDFIIIEAGAGKAGDIRYLCDIIEPDISIVTGVHAAHVAGFGSEAKIANEKSELYYSNSLTSAVLNMDSEYLELFLTKFEANKINLLGFSLNEQNACLQAKTKNYKQVIFAKSIKPDIQGRFSFSLFVMQRNGEVNDTISIDLQVPGRHQVQNTLAVSALALAAGFQLEAIKSGIENYSGIDGRMQIFELNAGHTLLDDSYNANPASMKAAIDHLVLFDSSILVIGDMAELGVNEVDLHEEIGRYARKTGLKHLYATGELSKHACNAFGADAFWYESQKSLIKSLVEQLNRLGPSRVLVKGSRAAQMDKVVSQLKIAQAGSGGKS